MMNGDGINTREYWDGRFNEDWEQLDGPAQSRFFSELALGNIPGWLMDAIKSENLTIADWGCAQGDGTDVWCSLFESPRISGIDFSEAAVQVARDRYPSIEFKAEDWLATDGQFEPKYSVVFSSNTLEHFHDPFSVLSRISSYAEKALILALPYREHERIAEHFFTFEEKNIPIIIADRFQLVWSRVVDCANFPAGFWPGEQIILVYVDCRWMASLELKLSDLSIEFEDSNHLRKMHDLMRSERDQALLARDQAMSQRGQALIERDQACGERDQAMRERDLATQERDQALNELDRAISDRGLMMNERDRAEAARDHLQDQLQSVLDSNSWVITRPLRVLGRLLRHGFTRSDARRTASLLKPYWRALPMPQRLRQTIATKLRRGLIQGNPQVSADLKSPEALPALVPRESDKPDYFVFSVIDWHFRHQRPQQLALQITSTGRRVFYLSVDFVSRVEPGFVVEPLDTSGRLFNVHLYLQGAPSIYGSPPTAEQTAQLDLSIGRLLEWTQSSSVVSLIQHSFWSALATKMPNRRLVYDCMDHHEGFGGVSDEMITHERALLAEADLTVTTSRWLDNEVRSKTARHVLIRNATEFEHFARIPTADIYKDPLGRRIIGYYGAIAEWFDVDLVAKVAQAFSDCAVVLIGADTVEASRKLSAFSNVQLLGEIPYKQLPAYAHSFDVCLLPFKVMPLTLATNPVKAYEYLSMGKPVVSTDLPEMREMGAVCAVASDTDDFVAQVRQSLSHPGMSDTRRAFAREQTWAHRAQALIAASEDSTHDPLVSVVVVTYNNLDLTKQCLASLEAHTDYAKLELIVVDNASSDDTPKWLTNWANQANNRKTILNDSNLGFAAANNQGLHLAEGQYLVMLNNDTYVTPGWLRTMVNHMRRDERIGLLGPVTNNIGNEARIEIFYDDMVEMIERAGAYTRAHLGQLLPLRTAAFFCVMLRREVFETIGPLDEAFGRGFFEDDDYCRRVEQAGLSVYCAEDVFIHHHLSASFNKLRNSDRQALFAENLAIYEAKWGAWSGHKHR